MNYETAKEIEIAIARWFGIRKYIIVPNVSWGFLPYEADMLLLSPSNYAWEVEIKVSRGDLLRDGNKRHQHDSLKVRQLWFAIPQKLERCIEHIPEHAGVFVVGKGGVVVEHRKPTARQLVPKLTDDERFQLTRLGAMRVWSLKERVLRMTATEAG